MIPTSTISLVIAGVVLIAGTFIGLIMAVRTCLKYPGKSLVTCPETQKPAAVHVNAGKAARDVLEGFLLARARGLRTGMSQPD